MEDGVFPNKKVIEATKNFVCVHVKSGHDPEELIAGAQERWGAGVSAVPAMRFADPDGKQLDLKLKGYTEVGKLVDQLNEVAKKTGIIVKLDAYLKWKAVYDDACAKLEKGETKKGVAALLPWVTTKKSLTDGLYTRTTEKLKEVEAAGRLILEEGRAAEAAQKWVEARDAYRRVADPYAGLSVAAEAKKALGALMANPEAKAALGGK